MRSDPSLCRRRMFLHTDSLLPYLKEKVRLTKSDSSRHLLCPQCAKRTKLNTLGDGRKKCTICGKKFSHNKAADNLKVEQCAQVLLCFCLDFSVERAVQMTSYRRAIVTQYYKLFQQLVVENNLLESKEKRSRDTKGLSDPHTQALRIIEHMPKDFLTRWV